MLVTKHRQVGAETRTKQANHLPRPEYQNEMNFVPRRWTELFSGSEAVRRLFLLTTKSLERVLKHTLV